MTHVRPPISRRSVVILVLCLFVNGTFACVGAFVVTESMLHWVFPNASPEQVEFPARFVAVISLFTLVVYPYSFVLPRGPRGTRKAVTGSHRDLGRKPRGDE